jgi:hypothetical protein
MLARPLGLAVPAVPPPVKNRVADWCVHEFREGGYRRLLLCNTATLYPLVTDARGVTNEGELIKRAIAAMQLCFQGTEWELHYQRWIVPELGAVQFAPIPDRAVLSSLNELILMARYGLRNRDYSPAELAAWLAQTPMKAIGHNSPDRAFRTLSG